MSAEGRKACALSVGSEWDESHEARYLFSYHRLHQLSDDMKFSNLLPVPKSHRRERSKARSEMESLETQNEADPVASRPAESSPDLRISTSTPSTSSPLAPRDQEPKGM